MAKKNAPGKARGVAAKAPAAPAAKPARKTAAQAVVVKPALKAAAAKARPAVKPAAKTAAKPAAAKPAAAKSTARTAAAAARTLAKAAPRAGRAPEPENPGARPALVRDSFTMPEDEYAILAAVKGACLQAGFEVKKSELLRIGVALLGQLDVAALRAVLDALPQLKTGRPPAA